MNALFKLKPGLFGLLGVAIAAGSFATAISKGSGLAPAPNSQVMANSISPISQASPEPGPVQDEPEPEQEYTYYQYAVDTDLVNLEQKIGNRALELLNKGHSQDVLSAKLWDLEQDWHGTPSQLVERIALHRAMQTLVDGEPRPIGGSIANPTVEGYRNAK